MTFKNKIQARKRKTREVKGRSEEKGRGGREGTERCRREVWEGGWRGGKRVKDGGGKREDEGSADHFDVDETRHVGRRAARTQELQITLITTQHNTRARQGDISRETARTNAPTRAHTLAVASGYWSWHHPVRHLRMQKTCQTEIKKAKQNRTKRRGHKRNKHVHSPIVFLL
jgi:hypothetical protein